MASRRVLSSALRAATAQTIVARPARCFVQASSRTPFLRLTAHQDSSARAVRRWYSVGADLERKVWDFDEIKKLVETEGERSVVIVDVREPVELFETGKIPGAINIPITSAVQSFHMPADEFEDVYGFPQPAKDAELLFYCKAGVRARAASGLAQNAGWLKVGDYPGSWLDWAAKEGPVERLKGKVDQGE